MQLNGKKLGFYYTKENWLFRGVDLSIEAGEIVGLTGRSGIGKTALCKVLSGYEKPQEGQVLLNNSPISDKGYFPVQLIFQHPEKAMNPKWKMEKVLKEGFEPEQELLNFFGIEKQWLKRWPTELSSGELQRFCIVRALGPKTKFLIADEMTANHDAITQAQIWRALIKIVKERNIGMLVISHDQALLQKICDRIIDFHQFIIKKVEHGRE